VERQQRARLTTVLVLALVFATGIVVGLAVDRTAFPETGDDGAMASGTAEGGASEESEQEGRRPMYEQVGGLSADQQVLIDSIVEGHRAARQAITEGWRAEYEPLEREQEAWEEENVEPVRQKWRARLDSLVHSTRDALKDVMTEDQARRYDSLLADYEQRRETRRREREASGGDRD
jgi:hypothetical protein